MNEFLKEYPRYNRQVVMMKLANNVGKWNEKIDTQIIFEVNNFGNDDDESKIHILVTADEIFGVFQHEDGGPRVIRKRWVGLKRLLGSRCSINNKKVLFWSNSDSFT
jgi:hypothetical protein